MQDMLIADGDLPQGYLGESFRLRHTSGVKLLIRDQRPIMTADAAGFSVKKFHSSLC